MRKVQLEEFRESAMDWWRLSFRLGRVTSTTLDPRGRQFGYSIQTDGVGCSVFLQTPKLPSSNVDACGFRWEIVGGIRTRLDFLPHVVAEGTPVVGLDPGRKDLFTTYSESGFERDGLITHLSVQSWRRKIGNALT